MCGLFGMTLPHRYPTDLLDRGQALTLLGELAEERGRDAAGVAARHLLDGRDAGDGWAVAKSIGTFRRLARSFHLAGWLSQAQAVLGHTRWATQGDLGKQNASPARAGQLLCTHNGDLDTSTIPYRPGQIRRTDTDSAVLFAALATAHGDRVNVRRLTKILTDMQGRAALAWTDRRSGGRIWLARAGLSPLAVGDDIDGGFWWASNPAWLRELSDIFNLPFRSIRLVSEGTLLSASPLQQRVKVTVHARFKPTVRASDQRLVRGAVWRNFTPADQMDDLAVMRHRTVAPAGAPAPCADLFSTSSGGKR